MTEKFVVRLMDAEDRLLAWTTVMGQSKPQGSRRSCPFFPIGQTQFAVEQAGIASKVVIHWCELDLARVQEVAPTAVQVGQVFTYTWIGPVWLVPAMDKDIVLPPVTIHAPVTVAPPTGSIAAVSQ